jgi:hypothetical protein
MATLTAEVDATVLARLARRLSPELYEKAVGKLVGEATLLVEREARLQAPKDTGALARSIAGRATGLTGRVATSLVYAPVMEYGRTPGARMPPPAAVEGWARRHGMTGKGAAFVLARAIGRRGIKGRFYMRRALEKVEAGLPALIARASAAIAAAWGA